MVLTLMASVLLLVSCVRQLPAPPTAIPPQPTPTPPRLSISLPATVWTPAEWQQDGKLRGWVRDQNDNFVDDAIDAEPPDKEVTAIVDFNSCINETQDVSFLNQYGYLVYVDRYVSFAIVTGLKAGKAPKLASQPGVAMVELAAGGQWLDTERQAMKVEASNAYPNASLAAAYGWHTTLNGSGVHIAILDTGVNDSLAELEGRYRWGYDATQSPGQFVNPPYTSMSGLQYGHGTEMALIVLGNGESGIAPAAGLVDVKVGDASGWKSTALSDALDVMLDKRDAWRIGVVNQSMGGKQPSDGRDAISQLVNRLAAAGIVVVAGAGNGPDQGDPKISYPGAASWAITVAAADPKDTAERADDVIANSTSGPRDDDKDADPLDELKPEVAASSCCATSSAAARVSGLSALILQKAPDINPGSLRDLLIRTAEDRAGADTNVVYPKDKPSWDNAWGYGLVDAFEVMNNLKKGPDLTFVGFDGSPHPSSPWYYSHAIQTHSERNMKNIVGGVPDKVFAQVLNQGTQNALNVRVTFGFYAFSASIPKFHEIGAVLVPTVPAGKSLEVGLDWVPPILPTGQEHGCIVVTIDYGLDGDFANMSNFAQKNVQVKASSSPATFMFNLENPLPTTARLDLEVTADPSTKADLSTWYIELTDVTMVPLGRCGRKIQATVLPPEGTPSGTEALFYVTAIASGEGFEKKEVGGVALKVVVP
ncbi:MAG: S8 family serine peptidase [Chloroflexi bacterium]|nr:S8 family serine peptidase [Chloroflexota bacterium]